MKGAARSGTLPKGSPMRNWSNLFLATEDGEVFACNDRAISALSELRSTGCMFDTYGPFRSHEAAEMAMLSDEPGVAGMSVEEIDWTGFYDVGGYDAEASK